LNEQAQEELARVALHGQRRRGVAERERARVAAAVAALTGTAHAMPLRSGRLQRGPWRLLADVLGRDLIDRRSHVGLEPFTGMYAGQPGRRYERVHGAAFRRLIAQVAHDREVVTERR